MVSEGNLNRLQHDLIAMDNELKGLMSMLDRGQTGRLFRPIVHLDPITRERVRTRLDFARSLIIKLATLLAVPAEVPDFLSISQSVISRQLALVQEYSKLTISEENEAVMLGLQAGQALQQLQESLQTVLELIVPAEARS